MDQVYNFSAGPAALPKEVLTEAREELLNYRGIGFSVMEMSHRSADFAAIINEAEEDLRVLLGVPDNYKILFLQGGASLQFAMVPLNLMKKHRRALFIHTGYWTKKAYLEAQKFGEAEIIASSEDKGFTYIPDITRIAVNADTDYVYICANNTIYGTRFTAFPDVKNKPLVADMSSCLLSEELDVSRFGLIFAGAQKNIGPAGVTVVIIREDLIDDNALEGTPTMLRYKTFSESNSLYNTPPTYAIYICGKVFKWLLREGGLKRRGEINRAKARIIYDYLDESRLFKGFVSRKDRSMMNVTFGTGNKDLDEKFVLEAKKRGLTNLKGHRSVGGMRASIYNAMPIEGVKRLVDFMREFERDNYV